MAVTKEKKVEMLGKLKGIVKDAESIAFVNFHGLGVVDTTELRSNLTSQDVGYFVAKKTLIKKALEDSKLEGELPQLDGELAIAYAKDLIAPAREVFNFQKQHKGRIELIGGVFEGKLMNKEEMMSIATIPEPQVLYGQFVNLINSPIQGLVMALGQIAEKREA